MDTEQFIATISKDASKLFTPETLDYIIHGLISFGLKLLAALAIYIIGAWIIRKCKRLVMRIFERRKTEKSLASFVINLISITLTVILIVIAISTLGINTTSIAALLASGGVAIGFALSGTLQNFAGGIMILTFKPFKSGDYIEAQGYSGTVDSIDIFNTKLTTPDNKMIMIPNGTLSNGTINNYSKQQFRRVDWILGVEYGTDFEKAKGIIENIISAEKDTRILSKPSAPFIGIESLSASSVDIIVKAWVKTSDYWDVFYDYNARFYTELPQNGINFPFPQMDVWLRNNTKGDA
ncbi:MAG: mechanosensitive ion channel [Bacteroidetes bacterium]|uniref:Mechanosensitive ion channel n=1 Tax=Candidatus Merdivivens pullistercoris TaxID=2840873 RepID=A0A9D9I4I0_9BACT|nr:mechanosensitive ion channel [Candidatus Merdivivens pullistercoris]